MKTLSLFSGLILIGLIGLFTMSFVSVNNQDPWEVPSKYKKMDNPYANVDDDEKIGRIMYSKHCKSCHGSKGKGDGTKAASLDTPVGDFTDGSIKAQTDGELYYKTFFGRDDMPAFEKKIPDAEDQWLLINYLKSLDK